MNDDRPIAAESQHSFYVLSHFTSKTKNYSSENHQILKLRSYRTDIHHILHDLVALVPR